MSVAPRALRVWGLLFAAALVACATADSDLPVPDAGSDQRITPDLVQEEDAPVGLASCKTPGTKCVPHDSCALSPICGDDLLCRPTDGYQDCGDGLECTIDICAGSGICNYDVKPGMCALKTDGVGGATVKCFAANTAQKENPCMKCSPDKSQVKWSPANGGVCDDQDACTRDDYCQAGVCKGARYDCSDGLACTDDVCDGKGGCDNTLAAGSCLIDGTCYQDGDADPTGCAVCDAKAAPTSWTTRSGTCLIDKKCFNSGDRHGGGCGSCDPSKSTSAWSLDSGKCLIDNVCRNSGDTYSGGCGVCDPAVDATRWSPPANTCNIDNSCVPDGQLSSHGCAACDIQSEVFGWTSLSGVTSTLFDFEAGLGQVQVSAPMQSVGWQVVSQRSHKGTKSLYYGNPATKNYDTPGQSNKGTATLPKVQLPAGQKATLSFWIWVHRESSSYRDKLTVKANGKQIWATSYSAPSKQKTWLHIQLPLWDYAGKNTEITFTFDTVSSYSNSTEGVYLDDVKISTGCGAVPLPIPFVMDGALDASAKTVDSGSNRMSIHMAVQGDHLYVATHDAGEGNDNFIYLSDAPSSATVSQPAAWAKSGRVFFSKAPLVLADENDSNYCAWMRVGPASGQDVSLKEGNKPKNAKDIYDAATGVNGGVLEGALNMREVFGKIPSHIYIAVGPWGTNTGGALAASAQSPATLDSNGDVNAGEILKVAIPSLTVVK